jgi:hypothetical protein
MSSACVRRVTTPSLHPRGSCQSSSGNLAAQIRRHDAYSPKFSGRSIACCAGNGKYICYKAILRPGNMYRVAGSGGGNMYRVAGSKSSFNECSPVVEKYTTCPGNPTAPAPSAAESGACPYFLMPICLEAGDSVSGLLLEMLGRNFTPRFSWRYLNQPPLKMRSQIGICKLKIANLTFLYIQRNFDRFPYQGNITGPIGPSLRKCEMPGRRIKI